MLCKTAQDTLRDLYIANTYLINENSSNLLRMLTRHRPCDDSDWKITDLLKCCIVNRPEYPVADILIFQLLWRLEKMLDSTISEAGHGNTRYHVMVSRSSTTNLVWIAQLLNTPSCTLLALSTRLPAHICETYPARRTSRRSLGFQLV